MATMTAKVGERERDHRRSRHEQCGHERERHTATGTRPEACCRSASMSRRSLKIWTALENRQYTTKAQAAQRTADVCRFRNRKNSSGRAKPFFTHCRMRSRATADLTTFQPNTPLSSDRKVVIGGPKRQCHDGRLRIYAGRTRQHAAVRHDDIVEAS